MHPRLFRLLEKDQRNDELPLLDQQARTTGQLDIDRLYIVKLKVTRLIHPLTLKTAHS